MRYKQYFGISIIGIKYIKKIKNISLTLLESDNITINFISFAKQNNYRQVRQIIVLFCQETLIFVCVLGGGVVVLFFPLYRHEHE